MHAAGKFGGECRIDHAVTFDTALSAERFRHDVEPEVRLAAGAVSGMALMTVRFVLDVKALRRESLAQLFGDDIVCLHRSFVARIEPRRNPSQR